MPSGELSDTRRLGSADARWYTSQGEKAVFRRRSMAARNAVKTPGETARGAGYPPNEVSRRRRSLEGREAEARRSATNSTRGATRGHGRGRSRYPPKRSGVAEGDALAGVRNLRE